MSILVYILAALLLACFVIAWCYGGLRENMGDVNMRMFPARTVRKGGKIEIVVDGDYNRTATISKVLSDKFYIYGSVELPISYRGTFYALGFDEVDGSKLIYVVDRKDLRYVRLAELVRKAFNVMDCIEMMPISIEDYIEEEVED